jgi:hypothetical protein
VLKSTTFVVAAQAQNLSPLALCAEFVEIGAGCAQDAQGTWWSAF